MGPVWWWAAHEGGADGGAVGGADDEDDADDGVWWASGEDISVQLGGFAQLMGAVTVLQLLLLVWLYVGVSMGRRVWVECHAFLTRPGSVLAHAPTNTSWKGYLEKNWRTVEVFRSRNPDDVDRVEAYLHHRLSGSEYKLWRRVGAGTCGHYYDGVYVCFITFCAGSPEPCTER